METEGRHDRRRDLGDDSGMRKPVRRIEFYWLCDDCAGKMTLTFDRTSGVSVRAQASAHATAAA